MKQTMELRIKRYRTESKTSVFEVLERWASQEGLPIATAVERVLEGRDRDRWDEYLWEEKNPGKATT